MASHQDPRPVHAAPNYPALLGLDHFKLVCDRLNQHAGRPLYALVGEHGTAHSVQADSQLEAYYDRRRQELVRTIYAEDFTTFGYSPELELESRPIDARPPAVAQPSSPRPSTSSLAASLSHRLADLYHRCPALKQVETTVDHRIDRRLGIFKHVRPRAVCAELGVFTGLFSHEILLRTQPAKLFMVDPWWKAFGERYPDWGDYTANGALPTCAAFEAASIRAQAAGANKAELVVDESIPWLETLPDATLDWVYLDTGQVYDATLCELRLLAKKLKPDGVIVGDDWLPFPKLHHYGIFRAVHQFVRESDFRLIFAGVELQWMLRRAP